MAAEEDIISAAVEVDETEKRESISKLDDTSTADDITSTTFSPDGGRIADAEAGKLKKPDKQMAAEEEIIYAAVEVDETEKKEVISKLDITAQTDDIISIASSPAGGQITDVEAGQQLSPSEHHVFFIPQVEKLPWPTFIFLTINCTFA